MDMHCVFVMLYQSWEVTWHITVKTVGGNSVALSPQANYTD
jgi:hypothetical protein